MKIILKVSFVLMSLFTSFCINAQTVSYTSLFDNTNFDRTAIDLTSRPVGAIDGAAGTSPSGAVNYTIPIKIPAGTNGMIPSISVNYNSQAGNGLLGQGWNLSSMSMITRAGKDFYHDGKVSPVTYTNDDVFMLDGSRLSPITGANGANGTTYRTEIESYATITSYGSVGGGPEKFIVVSKDGTTKEYGYTSDAKLMTDDNSKVMMYAMNKVKDINGNYVKYIYDNSSRSLRISEILYTGNDDVIPTLSPYNKLVFEYKLRDDKNIFYDGRNSLKSDYLLTGIEVKEIATSEIFKTYSFWYGKNKAQSYLKLVSEYNAVGDNLNDTRFKYGDKTTDEEISDHTSMLGAYPTAHTIPADLDGDGLDDLIVSKKSWDHSAAETWTTSFTIKKRTSSVTSYSDIATLSFSSGSAVFENDKFMLKSYQGSTADFNGDGRADLMVSYSNPLTTRVLTSVQIHYANSSGSISSVPNYTYYPPSMHNTIYKGTDGRQNYLYVGDFNGDGLSDFVTILNGRLFYNSPSTGIDNKMANDFTITTTGLIEMPLAVSRYFWNADAVYVINADGDAKSDLMVVNDGVTRIFTFNFDIVPFFLHVKQIGNDMTYPNKDNEILLGDFNGDGTTDLLTGPKKELAVYTKDWNIGYFNGETFTPKALVFDHPIDLYSNVAGHIITDALSIGDFDGDGKSDIYDYYFSSPKEHHIYYSTGSNFHLKKINTSLVINPDNLFSADFNGDGKSDLFANKSVKLLSFNPFEKSRQIEKVTDGFNRTTGFSYEPLTKGTGIGIGDFYTKGGGDTYPVNNVQFPLYVVTAMKVADGIGGLNTTNFKYENLRLHRAGRGLLGFEKVKEINITLDIRTESLFNLGKDLVTPFDFYTSYLKTTKTFKHSTNFQLSQTDNTIKFTKIGSGFCFKQEQTQAIVQDLFKGTTTTTNNVYDGDGNVTKSTSTTTGGETFSTIVDATYISTGVVTIKNSPEEIITTSQIGSQPAVATWNKLEYQTNGLLKRSIKASNTFRYKDNQQNMVYDSYGNLKKLFTTNFGSSTPKNITEYWYDTEGRFVKNVANHFGHMNNITTHKFWGSPLSVTDRNGLTTTYTYNDWGKLTSKTVPTSPTTSYTINYSDGWDVSTNQLYYSLVQDPSAPDVKTWYDHLGRAVKVQSETFGGVWTEAKTSYNTFGNIVSSTNSYLPTETPQTTTFTYDEHNRIFKTYSTSGTTEYNYVLGGGYASTTVKLPDGNIKKTTTDALGKTVESNNGSIGGTLVFEYDSRGNEITTKIKGAFSSALTLINKKYNEKGLLIEMDDKDAGKYTYAYDAYDRLQFEYDPNSVKTQYYYDDAGRIFKKEISKGSLKYEYEYKFHPPSKDYRTSEAKVSGPDGTVTEYFDYQVGGDVTSYIKDVNGIIFAKTYNYDTYNRLLNKTEKDGLVLLPTGSTLPSVGSGFGTTNQYDANGFLVKISSNTTPSKTLFENTTMNGAGQTTQFNRLGGFSSVIEYTNNIPTHYTTPGIQDLAIAYDFRNGNVTGRGDGLASPALPIETFEYDALNRLTKSQVATSIMGTSGPIVYPAINIKYDETMAKTLSFSRIDSKSDIGKYVYSGFPQNAVKEVILNSGSTVISHEQQDVKYNLFNKTQIINEKLGSVFYEEKMLYDANEDRTYTQQSQGVTATSLAVTRKRWYVGDYEMQEIGGNTEHIHYISSDAGLVAIVVKDGSGLHYYNVFTDHLGSIVKVTNTLGVSVAEQNYDAWGRDRNPNTWDYDMTGTIAKPTWLYRGYTGHEMLPEYGLINMNGRMYDPANGRMLRPDNFVTYPNNSQSYNRYSYAMNNPLSYTDPDGNNAMASAAVIGGFMGAVMYTFGHEGKWDWAQFGYSVGSGAIFGIMGYGIGTAFAPASNISTAGLILNEAGRAGAHGISGYIASGGNMNGFYGGAFGSIAGSVAHYMPGDIGSALRTTVGGTAFAAASGGAASAFFGNGNFWQGAAIGAVVHLVNFDKHKEKHLIKYPKGHKESLYDMWDKDLGDTHGKKAETLSKFYEKYKNYSIKSLKQLAWDAKLSPRYVYDPLNKGVVIDMRHFIAVGGLGEGLGTAIEIFQSAFSQQSGMNYQDFYSNRLGHYFYMQNGSTNNAGMQISSFLLDPRNR